eukprot:TRINITY_DN2289_c0_g1_i3.p1 TRINITY_DN2289_c0_g1~~TRINITY_DN2289_c0_g1_i3.p1  ORF type:complete len:203 (+),score=41.99 TRINITY_DN2289_c0_g1_i3:314-922(+)
MGSTRQERQILMLPEEHDDEEEQQEEPAQEQSIDWAAAILPFVFPALGGLLYGYDTGATSGALVSIQDAAVSGTDWYELSPLQVGLVVSGSLAGSLIGSILAFVVADCMGRRRELVVAALAYFIGSSFMSLAPSLPVLILGRLCYGLGMGLATIGSGSTFLGFAVIATAAAVFVYLMVPETKGMSLEEIERITSVGNLASLG